LAFKIKLTSDKLGKGNTPKVFREELGEFSLEKVCKFARDYTKTISVDKCTKPNLQFH